MVFLDADLLLAPFYLLGALLTWPFKSSGSSSSAPAAQPQGVRLPQQTQQQQQPARQIHPCSEGQVEEGVKAQILALGEQLRAQPNQGIALFTQLMEYAVGQMIQMHAFVLQQAFVERRNQLACMRAMPARLFAMIRGYLLARKSGNAITRAIRSERDKLAVSQLVQAEATFLNLLQVQVVRWLTDPARIEIQAEMAALQQATQRFGQQYAEALKYTGTAASVLQGLVGIESRQRSKYAERIARAWFAYLSLLLDSSYRQRLQGHTLPVNAQQWSALHQHKLACSLLAITADFKQASNCEQVMKSGGRPGHKARNSHRLVHVPRRRLQIPMH